MTELEKQLLTALEQLHQDYSQRLDEGERAGAETCAYNQLTAPATK
ncbi:MbeD/MobD family mobilization/exclusion protein, partial [Klebsiella pneumoniae]|nr:hypothetical protein [Klebsiella pneumoniae]